MYIVMMVIAILIPLLALFVLGFNRASTYRKEKKYDLANKWEKISVYGTILTIILQSGILVVYYG